MHGNCCQWQHCTFFQNHCNWAYEYVGEVFVVAHGAAPFYEYKYQPVVEEYKRNGVQPFNQSVQTRREGHMDVDIEEVEEVESPEKDQLETSTPSRTQSPPQILGI
jgi:hypothetical protein|uniref:Uncharacterized protein n=1 Tax=Eutreptiella gymnastica TaxID=73025 RepID=A0A7S4FT92_9EUGL|mmetsp:Transcript_33506/g.56084  ORF Transcript_33506/g.56084 Transcript_33506/m.56084 type:complete len:106 (+) Transcript_33506:466-783(+)